jgi:proline iminopeptidase
MFDGCLQNCRPRDHHAEIDNLETITLQDNADNVLAKQFDPIVLDTIMAIEERGDFDNPNYMGLLGPNFYEKHILRIPAAQWPDPVNRAFAKMNKSLYVTMQGPSEFGISGRLENWDVSKQLSSIKVPTLVIGAQHDTMDPEHMKWMSTQFKNGSYLYCEKGSHMAMYDDQETYFKGLITYLNKTK